MKAIWILLVVIAVAAAQTGDSFDMWKKKNNRIYSSSNSEAKASATYKANCDSIAKHNSNPKETYKQSANMHADMTADEVTQQRKGYKKNSSDYRKKQAKSNVAKTLKNSVEDTVKGNLKSSVKSSYKDQKYNATNVKAAVPTSLNLKPYVE